MSVFKNVVDDIEAKERDVKAAVEAAARRYEGEQQERVEQVRSRFAEAGVYRVMREQAEQMTQLSFWNEYHENTVSDRAIASIRFVPRAGEQPVDHHPVRDANVVEMIVSSMSDVVYCDAGKLKVQVPIDALNEALITAWFEQFARTALDARNEADKSNAASPSTTLRPRM